MKEPKSPARATKQKSNIDFRLMSWSYKLRDLLKPRINILQETGIKHGSNVLDFGCGPGSYITPLTELVGPSGKVYALDVEPLALQMVQQTVAKKMLENVYTILSDCDTGLASESLDFILLYDILHDLQNSGDVLTELYRVLKTDGRLSVNDHHLKRDEIISRIEDKGLFKLSASVKNTCNFIKDLKTGA